MPDVQAPAAQDLTPSPSPAPASLWGFISRHLAPLFVVGILAIGWLAIHEINTYGPGASESEDSPPASPSPTADSITLPPGKLQTGQFASEAVVRRSVQDIHWVPARIRYDETKHVDVKAPLDGILSEMLVTPGDSVTAGQLLAVIRSPEIGQARAEILRCVQKLEIARRLFERESELEKNLIELTSLLDSLQPIETIEAAITEKSLGNYQQELLATYSKRLLASELLDTIKPLGDSGAVPLRTVRERESQRQIAEAAFLAAKDQACFNASQTRLKAQSEVAQAERQLNLAHEALEALLGIREDQASNVLSEQESLSRLEVRAPLTGSVESRSYARNERVAKTASLLVLANTDSLYVEASIRESDWSAISLQPGEPVSVSIPALANRVFLASVQYVGREVTLSTNSVPLIATVSNSENLLRPGMFARVALPIGTAHEALTVKPESVLQHENQQFVFIDTGNATFQRVDVTTGVVAEEWIEITSGLVASNQVVTTGAFLLKSELLLQGEGE